jgi:hypothetical protein
MTEAEAFRLYVRDLTALLLEMAEKVSQAARGYPAGTERGAFEQGRAFAFNEVLSTIVNQAIAFDIPHEELGFSSADVRRIEKQA